MRGGRRGGHMYSPCRRTRGRRSSTAAQSRPSSGKCRSTGGGLDRFPRPRKSARPRSSRVRHTTDLRVRQCQCVCTLGAAACTTVRFLKVAAVHSGHHLHSGAPVLLPRLLEPSVKFLPPELADVRMLQSCVSPCALEVHAARGVHVRYSPPRSSGPGGPPGSPASLRG